MAVKRDGSRAEAFAANDFSAIGLFSESGAAFTPVALGLDGGVYGSLTALAVDPSGRLLVSAFRWYQNDWWGTVLALDPAFTLSRELPQAGRIYRDVPSALLVHAGELVGTAQLSSVVGACPYRFSLDLAQKLGCLGTGTGSPRYRGLAHLQ